MTRFAAPISEQIWDMKYRFKQFDGTPIDVTVEDTWRRIAKALAEAEKPEDRARYEAEFYSALEDFKFIPAGRIVSGAGTGRSVTLQNCYGMGTIPDTMPGIFDALKDAALTMQQGGGIGHDFSTIRPNGALVKGVGSDASGPLSFMDVWDSMCRTIMSAGARRGAMMGTMSCDHPDIEAFIEAKRDPLRLRNFNISVLVSDAFMDAVKNDAPWDLVFDGKVYKTISARGLWDKIMRNTYSFAEPGVVFIDRVNRMNPLNYIETIRVTNPCAEQPLPPYGACLLGSINLTQFVKNPFTDNAYFDRDALADTVHTAVRMLDNVIDVTNYPLPQQAEESHNKRRLGLGLTALADALLMLGMTYGADAALAFVDDVTLEIAAQSYIASAELAKEKGVFPLYSEAAYLTHPYIKQFPNDVQKIIAKHGLRNSHLTSIAPTGTISLYAGNVSSGIEPVFAYTYTRKVLQKDDSKSEEQVEDYAYAKYRDLWLDGIDAADGSFNKDRPEDFCLPDYFVSAQTLDPEAHVRMQAAAQKWVDSAISKTINVPEDIPFDDFKRVYELAYELGCKGCTTYRPNDITGSVLSVDAPKKEASVFVPQAQAEPTQPAPLAQRPAALLDSTYKIKWPSSDHAIYVTINDDEAGNPFEIFINSKDTEHFSWTVALTRMISAVFRRGGDVSFVGDELKAVFDPRGGAWMDGKYIPSTIAAIGGVIERHVNNKRQDIDLFSKHFNDSQKTQPPIDQIGKPPTTKQCKSCSSFNTKNESGCFQCLDCGDSKCG